MVREDVRVGRSREGDKSNARSMETGAGRSKVASRQLRAAKARGVSSMRRVMRKGLSGVCVVDLS